MSEPLLRVDKVSKHFGGDRGAVAPRHGRSGAGRESRRDSRKGSRR